MVEDRRIQFIVQADEPALFFSSKSAVERSVEAIDVEAGVYPIAFDRSGLLYEITAHGSGGCLVPDPQGKRDESRLRETLIKFLHAVRSPVTGTETLDELLDRCEPYLDS